MSKAELMRLPGSSNNPPTNEKLTLDVKEAAGLLGIGIGQMYQLTHRADFPKLRAGKRILIPRQRFIEWVNNVEVNT